MEFPQRESETAPGVKLHGERRPPGEVAEEVNQLRRRQREPQERSTSERGRQKGVPGRSLWVSGESEANVRNANERKTHGHTVPREQMREDSSKCGRKKRPWAGTTVDRHQGL